MADGDGDSNGGGGNGQSGDKGNQYDHKWQYDKTTNQETGDEVETRKGGSAED